MIRDHAATGSVEKMCRTYEVSRSGYYSWIKRPEGNRRIENSGLKQLIKEIFDEFRGLYGAPRIRIELLKTGIKTSRKRVATIMKRAGLRARHKRRFKVTTDSKHNFRVEPNLLNRDFSTGLPNRTWLSDITYVSTGEGWLYLAATMDLYSRKIVGWSMDRTMTRKLTIDALEMAVKRRDPQGGLLHHSDRGTHQYASDEFRDILGRYGMTCSMSRKGNCWDNALMESFFHSLRTELIYRCRFRTREQAKRAI
jgi:transposase InsO family protein